MIVNSGDNERRQYHRVSFDSVATLSGNQQSFDCQIIDLSIHGVLLRPHGVIYAKEDVEYKLNIPLETVPLDVEASEDSSKVSIQMSLKLIRQKPESLAFECENLDLDSITHLRKVVELNSGDPRVLERDLQTLCAEND
ncbi:MAG: PilZ domain-containing protein [Kangiella sp.]|nr:MAG: PilZ domain-containing protein [Kangiella sp.]